MRNFKKLSVFILISLVLTTLTGCASKTDELFKALAKSSDMKSYSFNMDGAVSFTSKQLPEENPLALDFSNMTFAANGDMVTDGDTTSKTKMNFSVGIMGLNIAMDIMTDAKVENDKANYKVFIQIPDMLKAMGFSDGDYFYLDSAEMEELQKQSSETEQIDPGNYLIIKNEFEKLSKGLISFTRDYSKKNKDFIQVTNDKEVTINRTSEKANEYTIALDNSKIKNYLKSYLSDDTRKKEIQSFVEKMNELNPPDDAEESSDKLTAKDFEDAIKDIDSMEDFIGPEGITLTFYVKAGYIVKADTKFHIIGENSEEAKYNFNMDFFNINEKLNVEIPTKDEVKTINLIDLTKLQEQGVE